MSFFSGIRTEQIPGPINGSPLRGLCEKVCIKDKKVFEISANSVEKISAAQGATNPSAVAQNDNIVSFNQDEIAQDLIDEDEIPF